MTSLRQAMNFLPSSARLDDFIEGDLDDSKEAFSVLLSHFPDYLTKIERQDTFTCCICSEETKSEKETDPFPIVEENPGNTQSVLAFVDARLKTCNSKKCKNKKQRHLVKTQYNPCLLYTSPSPRDATLSRMPSSA